MIEFLATEPTNNGMLWLQIVTPAVIAIIGGILTYVVVLKVMEEKIKRLEEDVKELKAQKDSMKTHVDQLLEFKTQAQKFMDKNIYKDQSPLSLTDFGKSLVTDSGFTEIFEQVKDNLVELLEQENPTTQYETQEKARALMDGMAEYQPFRPIQNYAFEHGKDLNQILRAGAIMLRDYYFEKHPELVNPKEDW